MALIPRPGHDPLEGFAAAAVARAGRGVLKRRRTASSLLAEARKGADWRTLLAPALDLLSIDPADEHLQRIAALLISHSEDRMLAEAVWRGVAARAPGSVEAFAQHLLAVMRHRGYEAAAALWQRRFGARAPVADAIDRTMAAVGLEGIGRRADAERVFGEAITLDPSAPLAWARLSALLQARGDRRAAEETLRTARRASGDKSLERRPTPPPVVLRPGWSIDIAGWAAPLRALLASTAAERAGRARPLPTIGSIVMIGGTLGTGGAERQLVASALALAGAVDAGVAIGPVAINGPVSLLCRKLDPKRGNDFFLPALAAAGVPVRDYLSLPRWGGDPRRSTLSPVRKLVTALPERMREGTERLTDRLADLAPDVVQIWQDGMIIAAGLAAALAGVPRIVLNVRTLPPSRRAERWRPEAETVYRGLLAMPGVVLTANSTLAARAYEDWLEIERGTVAVVPNGVAPLPIATDADEEARWTRFQRETGGGFTVGGVMRMDSNKRPIDWLTIAEALLRERPRARFVLVGDGEIGPVARDFARHRGLAERTLFVGRSRHVGAWLSRMDTFLLTSRFEGTPNVLIEAQLAGLPVVTTPAGAAAETIVPGTTGFVLGSSERIDIAAAVGHLCRIERFTIDQRAHLAAIARRHAQSAYSPATMLRATLEVFAAPISAGGSPV